MSATKSKKAGGNPIDRLMEQASEALVATKYFECERLSVEALTQAYAVHDYERMARILMPLLEARRQKRLLAVDTGKLTRVTQPFGEDYKPAAGCYLIEPPMVGVNGRDLRDRADAVGVPVLVVVREPMTRIGQWPVVMVGQVTVRTRLAPPANEKPTIQWLLTASESLGDAAIASVDPTDDAFGRVDELVERIMTITDHEKLHQALEAACREAAELHAKGVRPQSRKGPTPAAALLEEESEEEAAGDE